MADASLDHVLTFNRELTALSAAGLPIDLGGEESSTPLAEQLERINSALAKRVAQGQRVSEAIAEASELTPQYQAALSTWLHSEDPTVALDALTLPAEAKGRYGRSIGFSLLYPFIVLVLVYVGFLFLCYAMTPHIEAIYQQSFQRPSDSVSLLIAGRDLIPIWGPLVPLLLIAAVVWWRRRASQMTWNWVPGSSQYFSAVRNANVANQLATLVESGKSMEESLQLAGPFANQAQAASQADSDDSFPPLLRWAIGGDLENEPTPKVLRFVAQTYRRKAERQQTIWRVVAPTICGVLIGGFFVLAYGLGVFVPVVQLLKDVATPGGA